MGDGGTGKTNSTQSLPPAETFYICSDRKPLTYGGWRSKYKTTYKENGKLDFPNTNYIETVDPQLVLDLMDAVDKKRPEIKYIVIDTITEIANAEYMARIKESGYGKFADFAQTTYNIISKIRELRDDLTVIVMSHVEYNMDADGVRKASFFVIGGNMVKDKIRPETRFHMVLYTEVVTDTKGNSQYYFITRNNGKNTCRTPLGLFEDMRIPNDLLPVIQAYKKYEYGIE